MAWKLMNMSHKTARKRYTVGPIINIILAIARLRDARKLGNYV